VLVGTNNPATPTRTFSVAFTPDGRRILATNFRTNNVSIIDVARALANEPAEVTRIPLATPSGGPSRPRGVVVTADGRHAVITGAARGAPNSGVLWLVDLATAKPVATVTGVGNEAYLLDILPAPRP
jgi:DNA-binding beta-propeller fold protein YncE